MDFGDILNDWDAETAKAYGKKRLKKDGQAEQGEASKAAASRDGPPPKKELPRAHPVDVWLRQYGIQDKDLAFEKEGGSANVAEKRRQRRSMRCEATIDLHGCTRDEAWVRLETFFADCRRRGLQKVLIIHGKGTHSDGGSVLNLVVKQFIEQNRHAGESGFSGKEDGGTGSTWVLLK